MGATAVIHIKDSYFRFQLWPTLDRWPPKGGQPDPLPDHDAMICAVQKIKPIDFLPDES